MTPKPPPKPPACKDCGSLNLVTDQWHGLIVSACSDCGAEQNSGEVEVGPQATTEPAYYMGYEDIVPTDEGLTVSQASSSMETKVTSTRKEKRVTRASLAVEEFFANILYYGKPKTGKTTAAASVAKGGETVYIDAEAGLKSGPLLAHAIPVSNLLPEREISVGALDALFWELVEAPPYALVWDSISESHKKLLAHTVERRWERATTANKVGKERYATEIQDYGVNTAEMRDLSRKFRDIKCHTIFVALEKRTQDESTGEVAYGPDLTDKLASDILGYVDVICHTYTVEVEGQDEPEYWGAFRPFDMREGGDRFNMLPPRLAIPTADRVIKYLTGELDVNSDVMMAGIFERDEAADSPELKSDGTPESDAHVAAKAPSAAKKAAKPEASVAKKNPTRPKRPAPVKL